MRKLRHLFILLGVMGALVSCGKKKSSSSDPEPAAAPPAPVAACVDLNMDGTCDSSFYAAGTELGNYEELKNFYKAMPFNVDATAGLVVYHIGPDYGMSTMSFDVTAGFCLDLGFKQYGCDNQGPTAAMQSIIDSGEYKMIQSATAYDVEYNEAISVVGQDFVFETKTVDSSATHIREMLNLDNVQIRKTVVSKAKVTLTSGQVLEADFIEHFYMNGSEKRFVVAKGLPMLAQPVANVSSYGNFTGILNNVGTKVIQSVEVKMHRINVNYITNEVTVEEAGTASKSINNNQ